MAFVPLNSMPAATRECIAGQATPESYKWNFKHEAAQLLDQVGREAVDARQHADKLQAAAEDTDLDWRYDAMQLNTIRDDINNMGNMLCRLETIRRVASPQEQRAIDSAHTILATMAANADAAIVHLNQNQIDYWQPMYRTYAMNLYTDARKLCNNIKKFDEQTSKRS
jgi:hypothetical protein